jgi:hypothetical protein
MVSYSSGTHNIIRAQRLVPENENENYWIPVADQLHRVTGHHHKETIGYTKRIHRIHKKLKGGSAKALIGL